MVDDNNASDGSPADRQPIFILGILPRCGTNYLLELLCVHPDCTSSARVREDYLLYHVDLLFRYVKAVHDHWSPEWGVDDALRDRLPAHLGSGLISFLSEQTGTGRVVTKTPRVDNLELFFKLFPNAHLLILVRDGRSVLESGIETFGWNRESAMHRWAEAAQTILRFDRAHKNSAFPYLIVRYEDLWQNLEGELRRILDFLGLDRSVYDDQGAAHLPVKGSSTIRKHTHEAIHWRPVEKTADFDPLSRWRHWSRAQHERFNWVAGRYLNALGYEEQRSHSNRLFWAVWNLLHDAKWLAIRTLGPLFLAATRRRAAHRKPAESNGPDGA